MNDDTRATALNLLKVEFNLTSHKDVKNKWIIAGRIPDKQQERCVHIFRHLLTKHHRLTIVLMVCSYYRYLNSHSFPEGPNRKIPV